MTYSATYTFPTFFTMWRVWSPPGGLESAWLRNRRLTVSQAEGAIVVPSLSEEAQSVPEGAGKRWSPASISEITSTCNVHLGSMPLVHYHAEQPPLMPGVSESTCGGHRWTTWIPAHGFPFGSWRSVRRSLSWVVRSRWTSWYSRICGTNFPIFLKMINIYVCVVYVFVLSYPLRGSLS